MGKATPLLREGYGQKSRLEGEIGFRRRVHYMLLDEALLKKTRLAPGDLALFILEPREPSEKELKEKPGLAWARLRKA